MQTRATPDPDVEGGFILNGTKCWISGGMQADWFVVFAKTGDPTSRQHTQHRRVHRRRDSPGVTRPRVDHKMGVKGIDTTEIVFDDVQVGPRDSHRRRVPAGHAVAQRHAPDRRRPRNRSRRRRADVRHRVREEREAFGKTIADFQGIHWEIAKCATEIEAARLLTYRAAWLADQGMFAKEYVPMLSMAKYYASEVAVKASGLAVQLWERLATWKITRSSSTTATRSNSRSSRAPVRSSST